MAENVKQIQEFPQKTDFGDDDLLLIQGSGTTYNVQGRAVKKYAEDAAKPQVELAVGQAQAAAEAANRAEAAIVHPPIPDPATGNWMRWDQLTEEYVVTDIRAEGQDFEIRGFYPSFEALQEAVPDPKKGWAYGIGTEAPYEIYVWDAVGGDWKNNGPMAATGDMMRSTYDPQHKNKDIFDYADGVGLPPGGTVGQIPSITAESPRVVEWQDPPEGVGRSMAGKTVEPTLGTTVTAGEGAEIFNDYRDRSFNEESENPLQGNISSGKHSHSEGQVTTASGNSSHAENYQTIASGNFSHAEGRLSKSVGAISHAEGYQTTAGGSCSHAEGSGTTASGYCSHAEGNGTTASGNESHAAGYGTVAEYATETVVGSYNVRHSDAQNHENFKDKFVVGIGFSEGSRSNAFRVSYDGVYSMKQIASSGADYAEMFEWADGNPNSCDWVGRFVTLDGAKIRLAGPLDDYILGIVSGCPSVVGDVYDDQWQGMYLTDIFGRPIWEDVEVPDVTEEREIPVQVVLDDGSTATEPRRETVVIIPAHTERRQKLNPDYDNTQLPYIPRSARPEWTAVGLLGKLVALDNGTCQPNGWAAVGQDGVATHSTARTKFRMMERLDETHVRIMIL